MKKLFSLMLLCAAIAFASCSKDDDKDSGVPVTGVTLDQPTLSLEVGKTATLVATVAPKDADSQVTWSTSDASVATVDKGVVTAVKVGTATITVTSNADKTKTATCAVTVTSDYIEVNGTKWAIGNLVADGANGAKIGTATDNGLYFQFGSLIGWSETGSPTIAVKPAAFNGAEGWTATGKIWLGTEGAVPFTVVGSDNEKAGIGDPCRYYLKGTWRLPTKDEYVALFKNNGYPSTGPWKWNATSKSATNSTSGLTFPASGYRFCLNGSLRDVSTDGGYWSASPNDAEFGYSLHFLSSLVDPSSYYYRADGLPVRCVRESN